MLKGPHWYVVRTAQRREQLARSSIRAEGIEAYLPLVPKTNRAGETYAAPFFPSFLFARVTMGAPGWTSLFSARGVAAVLGVGGKPSPMADQVVETIRGREHEGFIQMGLEAPAACLFKNGERVKVGKGPFAALDAIFLEPIDSRRCLVLLQLLGDSQRIARADLAHIQVSAGADAI